MKTASKYALKRKRTHRADYYGEWNQGRQITPDRINGHALNYNYRNGKWN